MSTSAEDAGTVKSRIKMCVAACDALIAVSEDCADACLALDGNGEVTRCFLADLDCIEICTSTSRVLSWHTRNNEPTAIAMLETCRQACGASRVACERLAQVQPTWQTCSFACRRLSDACGQLLDILQVGRSALGPE